jgi:hypothetical protein
LSTVRQPLFLRHKILNPPIRHPMSRPKSRYPHEGAFERGRPVPWA